jgi:hypothetical protein
MQQVDASHHDLDSAGMPGDQTLGKQVGLGALGANDPRYDDEAAHPTGTVHNADDMAAFHVDDSAIPVYMKASATALKGRLHQGLALVHGVETGATDGDTKARRLERALRFGGEAMHTMQDFYAHSNFCEVAINLLLDEGMGLTEAPATKTPEDPQVHADVMALAAELKALNVNAGTNHLDTYVHETQPSGATGAGNYKVNGKEVMATGTFTMADTLHSVQEKVAGVLENLNPFAKGAAGEPTTATAICRWMDQNEEGSHDVAAAMKRGCKVLDDGLSTMEALVGMPTLAEGSGVGTGGLLGQAGALMGKVGAGASPGGDKTSGTATMSGASGEVAGVVSSNPVVTFFTAYRAMIRELGNSKMGPAEAGWRFLSNVGATLTLVNLARQVPIFGPQLGAWVQGWIDEISTDIRVCLEGAWLATVARVNTELAAIAAAMTGSTAAKGDNASKHLTQPTHTDIAKDFDADEHDHTKLDSLVAKVVAWGPAGKKLVHIGTLYATGGMTDDQATDAAQKAVVKAETEEDKLNAHRHAGAWLAPLADSMARAATASILTVWKDALDGGGDPSSYAAVDAEVAAWFAHPADCPGTWRGRFSRALIDSGEAGKELRATLAKKSAQAPLAQSPSSGYEGVGDVPVGWAE